MNVRNAAQFTQEAIRSTQDCEALCAQVIQHCLEVGGAHADASHLRLLQDCVDICEATRKIFQRRSPHFSELSFACASICEAAAAACERFIGDAQMKACANQCRLSAIACRQLVSASTSTSYSEVGVRTSGIPTNGFQAGLPGTGLQG